MLLKNYTPLVTLSVHHLRTSSSHLSHPLMSHDQVELHRILSTTSNCSFHRGSSATMSGSGSFSSEHMHHHTDTDDAPNPVYSSIPESQVAHHQYKDNQLQHQVRGVAGGCG